MSVTSFIPTLWSAATLDAFRPAEVVAALLNRDYEGLATKGNKVTVNALTIGDGTPVQDYKAAGRTHTVDVINSASQDLLIDQEKVIAFSVDDVDRVQIAGSFESVVGDAAKQLSEDAESFIIGVLTTGGTNANVGGTGVINSPQTAYDTLRALRKAMTKANVPAEGRTAVVNPDFLDHLLEYGSNLTQVDTSGSPEGLRNATVGRLLGFNLVESNMLVNADKPAVIGIHRSGASYVNQIEEVEGFRSQNSFADVVRMLHVYGAKVFRPTSVQYYLSA